MYNTKSYKRGLYDIENFLLYKNAVHFLKNRTISYQTRKHQWLIDCFCFFPLAFTNLTPKLSFPPVVLRPRTWLSIQSHPPKRITNPRVPKWSNYFLQLLGCGIGHPRPFFPNYGQILLGSAEISLLLELLGYIKIYYTVRSSAQINVSRTKCMFYWSRYNI